MWLIAGLIGFSAGIALQRFLIYLSVGSINPTICDFCIWKEKRRLKRKSRRESGD